MSSIVVPVPPHHEAQSFWTRYVWSQDHKVIAVQYACTAITVGVIGVVLLSLIHI